MAILTKEKESKNTTHIHFSPLDKNFMCKLYLFWVSRQPPNQVTDFFFYHICTHKEISAHTARRTSSVLDQESRDQITWPF